MIANNLSNLYEDKKKGGCAMPEVWKDVDFYLVDTAFKLFTSKEEDVATRAVRQIQHTGGAQQILCSLRYALGKSFYGDSRSYIPAAIEALQKKVAKVLVKVATENFTSTLEA
ncbi:hypothetical protein TNIN_253821 [Trichonephila inaurata madagascariensis]|uniref:Uncharacterized protein n=1 Tax=Trichonephila inaurata madagascariensis TaxID=2747483 RepID=A0A8X6Y7L7_9ARAC|nr:hypothetical protein TNIN_253821 [Trichonephila inaurata madagascariensis]